MRVLVTGSRGFIAQNLIERLGRMEEIEIDTYVKEDPLQSLHEKVSKAAFIFHLAGINRPENPQEFYTGNRDLTEEIAKAALSTGRAIPILMSSSIQAEHDNDYGKSKRSGEKLLEQYAVQTGSTLYIYRLPNVFGKWSRPNYNTVIATWCHNITRGLPIQINDPSAEVTLVYIDDVVEHFVRHLDENGKEGINRCDISPMYRKSLSEIHNLLSAFQSSRDNLMIPNVGRGFERALYATYLSFLPTDRFSYTLNGHQDERGTFYEFIKFADSGQVSISTTAPGITRGNHYHNTKNEKFLVIKGEASIKLRQIHNDEVIEYRVSDRKMEIVEMIPGYTHDITNTGDTEMVLLLWANEIFDRDNPDTFFLKV